MESINLLPDESVQLLVLPLGFEDAVVEKFKNIFQLAPPSERHYVMTKTPTKDVAVLLVNYDNAVAVQEKETLLAQSCPSAQVLALSHGPLTNAPTYHIRGILTAVRLLSTLDKMELHEIAPSRTFAESIMSSTNNVITLNVAASHTKTSSSSSGYRALVVDDSLAIQKSIELRLRDLPQITTIDFADDGESALVKASLNHYDIIFLDVMMPGIDGYQTCMELRKNAGYKKTPIIMVSGKSSPMDEVKGVIAGCTTYLIKPIQEEAFYKLSARVLAWLCEQRASNEKTVAC